MAGVQWIKLRIDMFDDEKIKIIQSMPDGDAILVIWIRLIALAGKCNADGLILVEDEFPYTDEMLAVIFNKPLQTVKLALATFEKFRMIESTTKGIYITNFDKHQNVDGMDKIREQSRVRKQRERERKKALLLEDSTAATNPDSGTEKLSEVTGETTEVTSETAEVTGLSRDMSRDVTNEVTEKSREVTHTEEEKEKEYKEISSKEEIKKERDSPARPKMSRELIAYQQIMDDYNAICVDLPPICTLSVERKRKLRTLINGMDKDRIMPGKSVYERLHAIFQKAHDSDFVSGRDGRWKGCSFDWLIKKSNALKVLEGTYANRAGNGKGNAFSNFPQRNYDFERMEREILNRGKT